jgi:peptidoglycan/xylan/chitin deacetylase (PgdA/CDA1 family)
MFTRALRSVASRIYWASPHLLAQLTGKVVILMYHRVVPRAEVASAFVQPGMYVTPETFEVHLRFLRAHLDLLSFEDLLTKWDTGDWDHRARYGVITFDDGWLDNYRYAYPLLREFRVPATVFLPTDLIATNEWLWSDRLAYLLHRRAVGHPREWDLCIERAKGLSDDARSDLLAALAADTSVPRCGQRRFVNWDEVREMSSHGISFGSHTSTHADLTRLTGSALECELRTPLDTLRRQRVRHVPVLAYPNGDYTAAVVAAARAAGYRAAVTTRAGAESDRPRDLFQLKRIGVHDDVTQSAPLLALHVGRQMRSRIRREGCIT